MYSSVIKAAGLVSLKILPFNYQYKQTNQSREDVCHSRWWGTKKKPTAQLLKLSGFYLPPSLTHSVSFYKL